MLFVHQRLNCFPLSSSQKMASTWGAVCLPGNSLCPRLAEGWKLEGAFCPGGKGVHASLSSAWRREVSSPKGPEASCGRAWGGEEQPQRPGFTPMSPRRLQAEGQGGAVVPAAAALPPHPSPPPPTSHPGCVAFPQACFLLSPGDLSLHT